MERTVESKRAWDRLATCALVVSVLVSAWMYVSLRGQTYQMDERSHYIQVRMFHAGQWELFKLEGRSHAYNAMIPGHHALVAVACKLSPELSLDLARSVGVPIGWGVLILAFAIARSIATREAGPDDGTAPISRDGVALLTGLQVFTIPVLLVLHPLLYTDSFSLLLCLAALQATLLRRHGVAGLLVGLSLLVRQSNIVFGAFLFLFGLVEASGWRVSLQDVRDHLVRCWTHLLAWAAFVVFVLVNGRIALDDPEMQSVTFSMGNPLLALILLTVGMAPLLLESLLKGELAKTWSRMGRAKLLAWSVGLMLLAASAYDFRAVHPLNDYDTMIRNHVLNWLTGEGRLVFVFLVLCGGLLLSVTKLRMKASPTIGIVAVGTLVPILLVEPRYAIPSLALWHLFREKRHPAVELALLVYQLMFGVALHLIHLRPGELFL
ncbi:MAG: hypothetical protein AAF533_01350 [Acidobacteriota bacterium]